MPSLLPGNEKSKLKRKDYEKSNVFEVVLLWVVLVDVRAIAISCISRFASHFY